MTIKNSPEPRANRRGPVILSLIAVYLIWGSTYLGIRLAVATIPPLLMSGVRITTAGVIMFVLLRIMGHASPSWREWRGAAIVGTLLMLGGTGFVTLAEKWVSSSLAAIAITAVPVWTCLFSGFWGRWPNRLEWIGMALGFAGIVILNFEREMQANLSGAVLLVLAAVLWALGSVLSRRISSSPGLMGNAANMIAGGAATLLAAMALGERLIGPPSLKSALAFLYLVIFGSMVGFSAYMYLLKHVRPALATSYAYVNPLVAVFIGVFLGGERITLPAVSALVVVCSGVLFVIAGQTRGRRG